MNIHIITRNYIIDTLEIEDRVIEYVKLCTRFARRRHRSLPFDLITCLLHTNVTHYIIFMIVIHRSYKYYTFSCFFYVILSYTHICYHISLYSILNQTKLKLFNFILN